MGERLLCKQEVTSSNLVISTRQSGIYIEWVSPFPLEKKGNAL